jgi:hypothetical protein
VNDTPEPDLTPYFNDPRTLREKMAAEENEWRPHQPEYGSPPMIAGLLLERGEFLSTLGPEPEQKPTLRILEWPANTEWKSIAFHGWLKGEIDRKDPQPGDYVVVAYNGVKKATKAGHNDEYTYRLFVEHNPAGRVVPVTLEPEPPEDYGDVPFGDDDIPWASEPESEDGKAA